MKTYEITATLHDGRVVNDQCSAYSVTGAIDYFIYENGCYSIQSLTVTELKP